ncbi:hypothetical protein ACVWZL_008583 [Bradyrhizobium sp. GM2.4]
MAGAKLVETALLLRRAHFQIGTATTRSLRATRNAPLLSPGTTTVSNTSRRVRTTRTTPTTISIVRAIMTRRSQRRASPPTSSLAAGHEHSRANDKHGDQKGSGGHRPPAVLMSDQRHRITSDCRACNPAILYSFRRSRSGLARSLATSGGCLVTSAVGPICEDMRQGLLEVRSSLTPPQRRCPSARSDGRAT